METDLAVVAVGLLTGAVTSFGQETASTVVQLVRERLVATPQGQAALAGVEAAPGDDGARREAERVLRTELGADPGFRETLAARLNVSMPQTQMSHVVNVHGTRMRSSQISLGPVTVNKPNTTAGLLGVAVALVVVAALLVYGVVQLLGEDPGNGEGKGGRARALSAVEAEQMLPGLTDLSGAWETEQPVHLRESDAKCHNVVAGYESQDRDGSGFSDLKVRYDTYACPDTAIAARGFSEMTQNATNPGSRKERPFPSRTLGDQSAASTYEVKDDDLADPSQVGSHLMWRARVGTVLIEMHYGPLRDGVGSEKQAEELIRLMCDRARAAQERG
ncbi:hypothetical protein ACFU8I_01980 [Streptomyces sp. NPDC057540]|uniref:hypothetical protein n=1 Tax=Streptomyces sp. NPDC057540 TaxID=3346160 RepID=UPI0036B42054